MSMPTSNPYDSSTSAPVPASYSSGLTRSMKLKRVDPLSCGKMLGALYVFAGLIVSVVMILIAIVGIAGGGGNNMLAGMAGGLIGAIFIPVFYGIIGFVGGIIMALLYNLCGSVIGGIEMQFEE